MGVGLVFPTRFIEVGFGTACISPFTKDIGVSGGIITQIEQQGNSLIAYKNKSDYYPAYNNMWILSGNGSPTFIQIKNNNFKDKVTDIKVKEQKRRWASCTGKNAILFNWRISMARADVLDYIVVHEMCHMDHRNHSKYFWNRVEEIMPNYKEKHEWLKINGMNLYL